MKISEAYDYYIKSEIMTNGGSEKTIERYRYAGVLLARYFGNIRIEKLDNDMVKEYQLDLMRDHKVNVVRGHISCFRCVIKCCKKKGIKFKSLDVDDISIPKREKTIRKSLSKEQVEAFEKAAAQKCRGYAEINRIRNALMIRMLFDTGLRIGELCSLDRSCLENGECVVVGKGKKPRVCFISDSVILKAQEYLELRNDNNQALFVQNQNGERMTTRTAQEVFRNICKKSGFDGVTPHIMRHSCASYMHKQNVDFGDISEFLGHESLDTTKIYVHIDTDRLRKIHDRVMN